MGRAATAGSVRDAVGAAAEALGAAGVDSPRLDAELLLSEATGWDRARLAAEPGAGIPPGAARRFADMIRRRLRREPVAYILARKGFRGIELAVDRRVLIPRPETELLVEIAMELRPETVLDVGTGSGAVALAIASELPLGMVKATDTSPDALEVARANARRLGLLDRVELIEGTVPEGEDFELTVANLPYVAEVDWATLPPEVSDWEPREALLAGPDGLDAIRALVPRVGSGALALEVGAGQASAVTELLRASGFASVETRLDLAGVERVLLGRR